MSDTLTYYFTIYGEVYTGDQVSENSIANHVILIERTKLKEYQKIKEKTLDTIRKCGSALPYSVIASQLPININDYSTYQNLSENEGWYSQYDRSVMFIFGAGASANCVTGTLKQEFTDYALRPPCGPDLFQKRFAGLYSKYPGVIQSLHALQGEHATDVETLFEEEWQEIYQYGNEQVIARHINIQYYLQDLLQQVSIATMRGFDTENLYAKLADRLQKLHSRDGKKKFAFVSFNQDTILEFFLKRYFRLELKSLNDYIQINEGPLSIFKPHGSWNWGWMFPNLEPKSITTAQWLFQEKINLHKIYYELLGDYKKMVDWESYGMNHIASENGVSKFNVNKNNLSVILPGNENLYFPALLLPYRDKDEFTMPSSHYSKLRSYLPHVKTLFIIGWKGNENLFNKVLKRDATNIKRIVIADPCPNPIEAQLDFLKQNGTEIVRYNGFEDFILNGLNIELPLM